MLHHAPPVQLTSFIGRERELAALRRLLETTRLLTVTGAGGSGKTRLALEVATQVAPCDPHGVAWVELASLTEPELVATHVATALGIHEDAGCRAEEAIIATLREQSRLLVLDNCEQIVDACARLADTLLRSCPALRILATSREALGVDGERSWLVPTLSLPDPADEHTVQAASRSEAVQLFVDRARAIHPEFTLSDANASAVARICRRVDGLPLAVELAAARVRVLTPEQIASRIDDSFRVLATGGRSALPRHRTLRAAIDWSYDLLSPAERLLLARLSAFAGGFTLESAERVCAGAPISSDDVPELLTDLVDKSLVAMQEDAGAARYRLLETVRAYAGEKLREGDPASIAVLLRRHAEYYRDFAIAAEPHAIVGDAQWLRRLDLEADNCRAALHWSSEHDHDAPIGLPLAGSLVWYWYHRQLWREGAQVLDRALLGSADARPEARAKALHGIGIFALYVGELSSADARFREAEAIWREMRNDRWLSFTLSGRTTLALSMGRPDDAEAYAEECVRAARRTGGAWDIALASAYPLMAVKVWRKDWLSADALLAESERIFRERHYWYGLGFVLDARAYVALQLGEDRRAAELAGAALTDIADRPDRWLASRSTRILSALAIRREQRELAATLLGIADGMLVAVGVRALTSEREGAAGLEQVLRTCMDPEAFTEAYAAGRGMTFRQATAYALAAAQELGDERTSAPGRNGGDPASVHSTRAATVVAPMLDVCALGALEIRLDGELIALDAWRYAKPRELLLYLLAHPAGRTREQIGLAFWPEASATQVKNNFHVALHHIRKALGRAEVIVFSGERYAVNWELGVECDATRFEREMRAVMRLPDEAALPVLEATVALYRGDFLEEAGAGDWHLEHRDRLCRLYLSGMLTLGEHLARAGRPSDAADAYRRLIGREPLHEEACRRLMMSLAQLGRRSEAIRHYERLVALLRTELEAEPEDETTALAERIRSGEHS